MLNGLAAHNQPHDALMLQAYSKAADVFSFGVVLWELITWQMPWEELGVFQVCTGLNLMLSTCLLRRSCLFAACSCDSTTNGLWCTECADPR